MLLVLLVLLVSARDLKHKHVPVQSIRFATLLTKLFRVIFEQSPQNLFSFLFLKEETEDEAKQMKKKKKRMKQMKKTDGNFEGRVANLVG